MDREALLKARLIERAVTLEGVGEIRIRGLSRAEVIHMKDFVGKEDEGEVWMLAAALVDPKLTVDDVRLWREAAPAEELEAVIEAIVDLSGIGKSAKQAMSSFPGGPGSPLGVHSGGPAGDDGGPVEG